MGESAHGLPAALGWVASFVAYVVVVMVADYAIQHAKGDQYTITYGVRYLIRHVPLLAIVLAFLLGGLVFGLFVHFAGAPWLWQP